MVLTDFEASLVKLQWVWYRLQGIYKFAPKIPLDNQEDKLFSQIVREMIMIQLDNFIVVRKKLLQNKQFVKLDSCLDLLSKPILDKEKPIKLLRNNYIAHIQDKEKPFGLMVQEIVDKYQVPTSFGDWVFLSGCASFYSGIINVNFKQETDKAIAKYDAQSHALTNYQKYNMQTYKSALGKVLSQTLIKLKSNGYKGVGI
ncbi:MAG: hypothetical protein KGI10_04075 [Thaumarchaeota archaeon]|nr:hypothetical protein [Nitrososphaerota archaeon]